MKKKYSINNKSYSLISKQKPPKCLTTAFSAHGVKWEMHKSDADINNPSCPHMHTIGESWKLNIYTGDIYDINTKSIVGKLK